MPWVRVDDGFSEHPKVLELSDAAFRLFVRALCYSARMLTDGAIPRAWLTGGRGRALPKTVAELVSSGMWDEDGRDFRIHDYLQYQPSRSDVEQRRLDMSAKRAEAGRKGASTRWQTDGKTNGKPHGKRWQTHGKPNAGLPPTLPSATDGKTIAPIPIPNKEDESKNDSSSDERPGDLLAVHHRLYLERYERKPAYDGAKDAAIAQRLIRRHGFEGACELVEAYFASRDPWIARCGHGFGPLGSATTINKLIAELSGRAPVGDGRDWAREFVRG